MLRIIPVEIQSRFASDSDQKKLRCSITARRTTVIETRSSLTRYLLKEFALRVVVCRRRYVEMVEGLGRGHATAGCADDQLAAEQEGFNLVS